jgi:hypothetical protein
VASWKYLEKATEVAEMLVDNVSKNPISWREAQSK